MSLKIDIMELYTRKTTGEISNILRGFRGEKSQLQGEPADPNQRIAILISGWERFHALMKTHWGIQVYVYELGDRRRIQLVALGPHSIMDQMTMGANLWARGMSTSAAAREEFVLKHSMSCRAELAQRLTE